MTEFEKVLESVKRELPRRIKSVWKPECEITAFASEPDEIQLRMMLKFADAFSMMEMHFWCRGRDGAEIVEDALAAIRKAGKAAE